MASVDDIPRISNLHTEYLANNQALLNLNNNGRIVSMQLSGGPPISPNGPTRQTILVNTRYMDYPPQMTESIKQLITARQEAIRKELSDLGVDLEN